jgi:hypothetical protein
VSDAEVEQITIAADEFFRPVQGSELMPMLIGIDTIPIALESSLLASLYYFRISRALIGCWIESVKPLLFMGDKIDIEVEAVLAEAQDRARFASSAYQLMLEWDLDMERYRSARAAVDQVTLLPMANREMRELVTKISHDLGIEPPSLNQVRRRLGAWFRGSIRERIGPLEPPVNDLTATLQQLARIAGEFSPQVTGEIHRIVTELGLEQLAAEDEALAGNA